MYDGIHLDSNRSGSYKPRGTDFFGAPQITRFHPTSVWSGQDESVNLPSQINSNVYQAWRSRWWWGPPMFCGNLSKTLRTGKLKGYALCRWPLDTGGSCLPLCRKHEMNPKETRNWPKQTICMCVWHCAHASSMDPCRMTRTTMCSDTFSWLKK